MNKYIHIQWLQLNRHLLKLPREYLVAMEMILNYRISVFNQFFVFLYLVSGISLNHKKLHF